MDKDTQFDMLYFDDCPSWKTAAALLEQVVERMDLAAGIDLVRVETDEEAQEQRFVGSPSIRLNGKDLFPVDHDHYALGCRVYQTPEGMRGWPTEAMLIDSIRERIGE